MLADAVGERAAIATMGVAVLGLLAFSFSAWAATRRTPAAPRALRTMPLPAYAIGELRPQKSGPAMPGGHG